jgi:hypothetical protein
MGCVAGTCSASDVGATLSAIEETCRSVGAPIELSSIVATPSSSTAMSSAGGAASSSMSRAVTSPATASTTLASSDPPSGTRTTTTTPSSNAGGAGSTETAEAPHHAGLSAGAAAGIAVGVTLLVVLLALAGFLCYRRRSRSTKDSEGVVSTAAGEKSGYDTGMMLAGGHTEGKIYHEADGLPRNELEDQHGVAVARERAGLVEVG